MNASSAVAAPGHVTFGSSGRRTLRRAGPPGVAHAPVGRRGAQTVKPPPAVRVGTSPGPKVTRAVRGSVAALAA